LSASLSVLEGMAARDCRRERCSPSVRPRPGRRLNGLLGTHGRAEPLSDRVWCLSHTPVPRRAVCRTQAPLPRNGGRRRGHHVRRCPGVVALSGLAAGAWGGQPTGHDTEVAPPSLGRNTGEAGRCARGGVDKPRRLSVSASVGWCRERGASAQADSRRVGLSSRHRASRAGGTGGATPWRRGGEGVGVPGRVCGRCTGRAGLCVAPCGGGRWPRGRPPGRGL